MAEAPASETILLVDAAPLQCSTVGQYLRDCGYRVIEATAAAEAITALSHQDIEILVADIALRDESGFQLSAKARKFGLSLRSW
ncbi:response regulator [Rhizobium leguminosarum]|uniref:response regulator n=1 Tax=Rhizobium leguminosarum TaxID=384 RepID=UPI001FDEA372|nr:response regulator [Rhizobium leguminosarum]